MRLRSSDAVLLLLILILTTAPAITYVDKLYGPPLASSFAAVQSDETGPDAESISSSESAAETDSGSYGTSLEQSSESAASSASGATYGGYYSSSTGGFFREIYWLGYIWFNHSCITNLTSFISLLRDGDKHPSILKVSYDGCKDTAGGNKRRTAATETLLVIRSDEDGADAQKAALDAAIETATSTQLYPVSRAAVQIETQPPAPPPPPPPPSEEWPEEEILHDHGLSPSQFALRAVGLTVLLCASLAFAIYWFRCRSTGITQDLSHADEERAPRVAD